MQKMQLQIKTSDHLHCNVLSINQRMKQLYNFIS